MFLPILQPAWQFDFFWVRVSDQINQIVNYHNVWQRKIQTRKYIRNCLIFILFHKMAPMLV